MIKFFRQIRKDLMEKNKTRRYLAYAFGEIILVVIGILIALQINNWNEDRKDKASEQKLLVSLLQEFENNADILDKTIEINTKIYETCIKVGEITGPELPEINEAEVSQKMVGAFKYDSKYIPNLGTLNELNNSGKLSLISDPTLRNALSEWQSQIELVKNQENYVIELRNYTHAFFINNGNFRRHLNIIEDALLDVKPSRFPHNHFHFLTNPEFESNLYLFIIASVNLNKTYYTPLQEQTALLIERIRQNID